MNTHSAPDQGGDAMELDQTQTSPRSKHALWGFDHPPLDVSRGSNGQHLTSAYVKHTISKDSIPLRKPSSEPSSSPQRRPEALSWPLRNPECSIPLRPEYQIRQGEERFTRVRRNFVNENDLSLSEPWGLTPQMIGQSLANAIHSNQPRHRGGVFDGLPNYTVYVKQPSVLPSTDQDKARRQKELDDFLECLPGEFEQWSKEKQKAHQEQLKED